MSDTDLLNEIISRYTVGYRKEAEQVRVENHGDLQVVHMTGYPEAPSHGALVDVHFIKVGFTEASADEDAFRDALKQAMVGHGVFSDLSADEFKQGPSYITVGGWLGSQDQALRLFALIEHYGMGEVITPARLHITGEEADKMAGVGYVLGLLRNA